MPMMDDAIAMELARRGGRGRTRHEELPGRSPIQVQPNDQLFDILAAIMPFLLGAGALGALKYGFDKGGLSGMPFGQVAGRLGIPEVQNITAGRPTYLAPPPPPGRTQYLPSRTTGELEFPPGGAGGMGGRLPTPGDYE